MVNSIDGHRLDLGVGSVSGECGDMVFGRCIRKRIPRVIIFSLTPCPQGVIYREVVECFNRWEADILIRQLYEADFSFNCYVILEVLR